MARRYVVLDVVASSVRDGKNQLSNASSVESNQRKFRGERTKYREREHRRETRTALALIRKHYAFFAFFLAFFLAFLAGAAISAAGAAAFAFAFFLLAFLRAFFAAGAAATGAAFFDAFFLRPAIVRPLVINGARPKRARVDDTLHAFHTARQVVALT